MNTDSAKGKQTAHQITLHARESMEVRGVTEVISFDEESVILRTLCGNLSVEGASLHIHVLSIEDGIVTLDGKVDSINYEDITDSEPGKGGFFGKLFR